MIYFYGLIFIRLLSILEYIANNTFLSETNFKSEKKIQKFFRATVQRFNKDLVLSFGDPALSGVTRVEQKPNSSIVWMDTFIFSVYANCTWQ